VEVNCNERRLIREGDDEGCRQESAALTDTRGYNGSKKALPQASNVSSDKRHGDGGQEVAREYATEKKRRWWLAIVIGHGMMAGNLACQMLQFSK
jgi:hypothetical protein